MTRSTMLKNAHALIIRTYERSVGMKQSGALVCMRVAQAFVIIGEHFNNHM